MLVSAAEMSISKFEMDVSKAEIEISKAEMKNARAEMNTAKSLGYKKRSRKFIPASSITFIFIKTDKRETTTILCVSNAQADHLPSILQVFYLTEGYNLRLLENVYAN